MPYRLPSLALVLTALLALSTPGVAGAQDSTTLPDGSELPGLPSAPLEDSAAQSTGDEGLPTSPDDIADLLGGTPVEPGAEATTPDTTATTPDAGATGAVQGTTPVPPGYLAPGPGAEQQPIRGVARLTEPDVPLEPLRLGALIASLIAILLVAIAALMRALGVRTPVSEPLPAPATGPLSRIGERLRGTADDMRDFLRRTR
ncbi:MAG: hypothetical protein J7513_11395 [Solirubrobacteraceae bacterium]|nr:hypothetical protein [Solirubrobacteraceae bacterium]